MLRNFFHEESRISRGKLPLQFTDVRVSAPHRAPDSWTLPAGGAHIVRCSLVWMGTPCLNTASLVNGTYKKSKNKNPGHYNISSQVFRADQLTRFCAKSFS